MAIHTIDTTESKLSVAILGGGIGGAAAAVALQRSLKIARGNRQRAVT